MDQLYEINVLCLSGEHLYRQFCILFASC